MELKNKMVTFAVHDTQLTMTPDEIENSQFTKVHFRIYSADKVNDHNYICSLNVLKEYANTIAGKPILAWYNRYANNGNGDFAGHEDNMYAKQYPVGFFPNDVEITYEKDNDGTIFLCADGYIWTVYYSEIVKVFEDYGGVKDVSCEMLVIDSEIIEGTDIENILQYSFTGLTLIGEHDALGTPIKPAVDGCQGKLVTNTAINAEYEKAKIEFEKILYNSVKQEPVETDSYFNTKNKEEKMEEKIIKDSTSPEVIENATQEVTNKVKVSTEVYSYDDKGHFIGTTCEQHSKETTEIKEVPENEVVEPDTNVINEDNTINNSVTEVENVCKTKDSTVDVEEFEALKSRCSALEQELATKNAEYDTLMQKCLSLEEYKNNKEKENMKNEIEVALNSVSHILNSAQIDEWRKESEKCSVDNADEFTNKLKAFAFDIQEKNGVVNADPIRNSIPLESEKEPADFWERMEKKYR